MSELAIDTIRKQHEILYDKIIGSQDASTDAAEQTELLNNVETLLEDLRNISAHVTSFDDYSWLSEAVVQWQVVFSSLLNRPKNIRISPPPPGLRPMQMPGQCLLEEELSYWLERHEKYFECYRQAKYGRWSTAEEKASDRGLAKVFLASDIIDGKINLALRIAPSSYWRLEDEWMEDLKRLRAYLLWLDRQGGIDSVSQDQDYTRVCHHLRSMLINPDIKAPSSQFNEVKTYLEQSYLRRGKIDLLQKKTYELIGRKAYRLYERTGQTDAEANWHTAEIYIKMFYENIIPAVMDENCESARVVLKAVQTSRDGNTYHIINCFEATLITYFLNPAIIQALWNESKDRWDSPTSVRTVVPIRSWPANFVVPLDCEKAFEFSSHAIAFNGVMSSTQKDALLAKLSKEYTPALEDLFTRSRIIHHHTTL